MAWSAGDQSTRGGRLGPAFSYRSHRGVVCLDQRCFTYRSERWSAATGADTLQVVGTFLRRPAKEPGERNVNKE